MLVHICCSVDSHFFLQELQKNYPEHNLIGFFYDPNIHPYSEYRLRFLDVKRSCKKLGIKLIEGKYDFQSWCEAVRGLENEPEKGKRCNVCFDDRLEKTALKAKELDEKIITTTLLTSPKKSIENLSASLEKICTKLDLDFIAPDFRKNGGTSRQFELAKKDMLYHQNYCGCLYALKPQRDAQKKYADELACPLGAQVLPASIEERIRLYKKVIKCEKQGQEFFLRRESFLNYRLTHAMTKKSGIVVPSYVLFYSHLKRPNTKGRIEKMHDGIGYFNRENIIFISLKRFNLLVKKEYKNVKELMFFPPKIKDELKIRKKLQHSSYSHSPIIVLDELSEEKIELTINSHLYQDSAEFLVLPN